MKDRIFISTSIPYVNAAPHIGYALEAVQADTIARWYRSTQNDVFFLSGTDENAIKNVESAEKKKISPQELVDMFSKEFFKLKESLNLSFDEFIRTTSPKHKQGAQAFWEACRKLHPDDIYSKEYKGLYCVGCETFYKDGEFPDNICPLHNRPLDEVVETNYFFALSKYAPILKQKIESDEINVFPRFRKKELLNMIEEGLEDFSVSRPVSRTKGWGIGVPGDDTQMIYVWYDALTNYITALDYGTDGDLFHKYWLENKNRFHIIGKDIVKFHALYWPAMLMSANVPLFTKLFVHGFITSEGQKISKSLGNVIDPFDLVNTYGADAVRYYLLKEIPSLDDGDYSHTRMHEIYNADLANELGNLVMRITTLAAKDEIVFNHNPEKTLVTSTLQEHIESYQFAAAVEEIWRHIKDLNKKINEFEPWSKSREDRKQFLTDALQNIYMIGHVLNPFMPHTGEKITSSLSGKIAKMEPLFPRLK